MDKKDALYLGRNLLAFALIVLFLACRQTVFAADTAAGTTSTPEAPSYKDICAADQLTDAATDSPQETAKKATLRSACASYQMQVLANLTGSAKRAPVEQALTAIAAIPHPAGTLSSPSAADHVGQTLSELVLAATVRSIGTAIAKTSQWRGLKSVVVLNQSDVDSRIQIGIATNWLYYVNYSLNHSERSLKDTVGFAQQDQEEKRKAAAKKPVKGLKQAKSLEYVQVTAGVLEFVPLAISAAEAIAGTMKIDATLASISSTPKTEVIFAALAGNPEIAAHLYFPGGKTDWGVPDAIGDGLPPDFGSAFASLVDTVEEAQNSLGDANAEIAKEGGEKSAFAGLVDAAANFKAQVVRANQIIDQYQMIPQGKTQSSYQDVMILSAKVAPRDTDAILVITPSTFGAHGGVITSQWRSQRLAYDADMVVSYTLADTKGHMLDAGIMYGSGHAMCGVDEDCFSKAVITTSTGPMVAGGNQLLRK